MMMANACSSSDRLSTLLVLLKKNTFALHCSMVGRTCPFSAFHEAMLLSDVMIAQ